MMSDIPESVTLIPIDRIEVLNSRDRNMKVFEEIVDNIRQIGLKKPITVTERASEDGQPKYLLVCGEGRLNAFRILGETQIPALIVDVDDEDAFIMSLAENIARRGHRPLEILADIEVLRKRGYSSETIIDKTGLSPKYVKDIVFLLEKGEERLIEGVQRGNIPLTTALEIARASEGGAQGDANLGDLLQEAYENGQLKGRQIIEAKRLIEKREEHGPSSPFAEQFKPPTSSYSLVRTYQKEVERQRKMVLKAEHAHQRLLLVVQGLKTLFADEHFVNLLRAEQLDTLPKYLAEKISVAIPQSIPALSAEQPSLEGASS
jgi:ParB family transcriptional regulator, chromosome partitioning protein